ncbi:DUF4188 domain-containing protein [Sphingomonas immobilis]|uniref:DUF4188 domain-containing protein n=1 Tax=Sphingomonas immobilis TaxID=3063997 RepID=A0ABT9A237_9SPHN|nr:DUF4188 domain-containing protein [Sphingomonas sp. CA1-15]MDO7843886.1 DUF4188 domain-containing protein [Sphingomonas sp. CA1-15]
MQKPVRESVDLSAYPDLVVILLGFRVRRWRGILSLFKLGPGFAAIKRDVPDGLLLDENFLFGLNHLGIRQYWRDYESLEAFTRSAPHSIWWRDFLKDSGGAGFWHETYRMKGGMEAVYIDMPKPMGFGRFAPARDPKGPFMTARARLGHG